MVNITKLSRKYILDHASVRDCLKKGLINYSALSREICSEHGIKNFDAVLVACRRYRVSAKAHQPNERKILTLVRKAKIRMRNKIVVAITEKPRDFNRIVSLQESVKKRRGDFHLIEGDDALVIITNSDYIDAVRDALKGRIKKVSENLVQISMVFDERLETTPGVVSFVFGLLADRGINVLEEMSCWTDLMFVVAETDAERAIRLLSR